MSRFSVVGGKMVKTTVTKNKFSQLNNKSFYFPNGIVFLPFPHPILPKIDYFKEKKDKKLKNTSGMKKKNCSV